MAPVTSSEWRFYRAMFVAWLCGIAVLFVAVVGDFVWPISLVLVAVATGIAWMPDFKGDLPDG